MISGRNLIICLSLASISLISCSNDDVDKNYSKDIVNTQWYKVREKGTRTENSVKVEWDKNYNSGRESEFEYLDFYENKRGLQTYKASATSSEEDKYFNYEVKNGVLYIN